MPDESTDKLNGLARASRWLRVTLSIMLPQRVRGWPVNDPYHRHSTAAKYLKARVQMVIGLLLGLVLLAHALAGVSQYFWHCHWAIDLAREAPLAIVAKGLEYTAGVELAYMLFTEGPDEALTPVILGVASAILLVVSDSDHVWRAGILVPLLTAALGVLFYVKGMAERNEREEEAAGRRERSSSSSL